VKDHAVGLSLQLIAAGRAGTLSIMQPKATTVDAYLAELLEDRRTAIAAVRKVIVKNLDKDYAEGMQYGMIGYFVPHTVFPPGYHCDPKQPLPLAALASQKNYMSLYLTGLYCGCGLDGESLTPYARWFQDSWAKTGKKLDMGKACIRFKKVEDLALDLIGEAIKRMPAKMYIEEYQKALAGTKKAPSRLAAKEVSKKAAPKTVKKALKKAAKKSA